MADDRWRRPAIPTESAASAALRLVQGYSHNEVIRRDRSNGEVEVVGLKRGRLNHFVVHDDGAIELINTLEPPVRYRWGRRFINAGLMGWVLVILAAFVFQPENSVLWVGGGIVLGWLLGMTGALLSEDHDLEKYVLSRTGSDEGWTELPYKLGGWPARTSRQLETVKHLSDQGDGSALVRNRSDGSVEVVTTRKGRRYTHLVDPTGVSVDEQSGPISLSERWELFRRRRRRAGEGWFRVQTAVPSD